MVVKSSSSYKRSSSASRPRRDQSQLRQSKYSSSHRDKNTDARDDGYLVNSVVAFEEFGEAQDVMKLFEFKDKKRTSEQLKRNVLIKIEVCIIPPLSLPSAGSLLTNDLCSCYFLLTYVPSHPNEFFMITGINGGYDGRTHPKRSVAKISEYPLQNRLRLGWPCDDCRGQGGGKYTDR